MQKIIHLFKKAHNLYLWVEAPTARYYAARYPHQLDHQALRHFIEIRFSEHSFVYDEKEVSLPCDVEGVPIPSSIIAKSTAKADLEMTQLLPWTLCVAKVQDSQQFLDVLKQYDFKSNERLARDAEFWIYHPAKSSFLAPYSAFLEDIEENLSMHSFWGI